MNDKNYPEAHLFHSDNPEKGKVAGGMFPVIYGWDESAAVRDYARAVGLPEGEPICI